MADKYDVQVAKRSWWEWVLWVLWVFLDIFLFQSAIASGGELEPRAATIFWVVFFVVLIGGVVVWYLRRSARK